MKRKREGRSGDERGWRGLDKGSEENERGERQKKLR